MNLPDKDIKPTTRFDVLFRYLHDESAHLSDNINFAENDAIDELTRIVLEVTEESTTYSTST